MGEKNVLEKQLMGINWPSSLGSGREDREKWEDDGMSQDGIGNFRRTF